MENMRLIDLAIKPAEEVFQYIKNSPICFQNSLIRFLRNHPASDTRNLKWTMQELSQQPAALAFTYIEQNITLITSANLLPF